MKNTLNILLFLLAGALVYDNCDALGKLNSGRRIAANARGGANNNMPPVNQQQQQAQAMPGNQQQMQQKQQVEKISTDDKDSNVNKNENENMNTIEPSPPVENMSVNEEELKVKEDEEELNVKEDEEELKVKEDEEKLNVNEDEEDKVAKAKENGLLFSGEKGFHGNLQAEVKGNDMKWRSYDIRIGAEALKRITNRFSDKIQKAPDGVFRIFGDELKEFVDLGDDIDDTDLVRINFKNMKALYKKIRSVE